MLKRSLSSFKSIATINRPIVASASSITLPVRHIAAPRRCFSISATLRDLGENDHPDVDFADFSQKKKMKLRGSINRVILCGYEKG